LVATERSTERLVIGMIALPSLPSIAWLALALLWLGERSARAIVCVVRPVKRQVITRNLGRSPAAIAIVVTVRPPPG